MHKRSVLALCLLMTVPLASGCARSQASSATSASLVPVAGAPDGAEVLQRACTVCHNLGGLSAYSESWGEPEWRSMVETMIAYGAVVTPAELDVLAPYLAVNFGTEGDSADVAESGSGEMAALLDSACDTCHGLDLLETNTAGFGEEEFRQTILRMIQYGSPVPEDRVEPMVAYLVENYGN